MFFQKLTLIMSKANKELQDKQLYIKKKFYHLKTSNLGEKEYRMKEKALQLSEITEINEIKEELLKKLSLLKLPGFKSKEDLIQDRTSQLGTQFDVTKKYELEERSYIVYKNNQINLLETLLKADYSMQPISKPAPRMDYRRDNQGPPQKKVPYIPSLTRREKKPTIVKLSKILRSDLAKFEKDDFNNQNLDYSLIIKTEEVYSISTSEIKNINKTRSDKSYYDESEIEETYKNIREFLTNLKASNNFQVENLDNDKLGMLVDAVSFSLNGVHYYQKLKKTKSMIHPIDILYILSKFK